MIWFVIIVLVLLTVLGVCLYVSNNVRHGDLTLITGGVKTGKTHLSVALAEKDYHRALWKWRIRCLRAYALFETLPEKPLLYSNMPLGKLGDCYVPLDIDLITGAKRFRYGSVVYYNEASLIAGSKDIKNEELNDHLLRFFKLCSHATRGGKVILDTQSPHDVHYTIKRSLSTYLEIWRAVKLPFVTLMWVRENKLTDGERTEAMASDGKDYTAFRSFGQILDFHVVSHKWWRYYDRYAYSALTDHLPVQDNTVRIGKSKKVSTLVRCRDIANALKDTARGGNRNEKP